MPDFAVSARVRKRAELAIMYAKGRAGSRSDEEQIVAAGVGPATPSTVTVSPSKMVNIELAPSIEIVTSAWM